MNAKLKRDLIRLLIGGLCFVALEILLRTALEDVMADKFWIGYILYIPPYLLVSYDVLFRAAENIRHGQVFDENFLMIIATFGAFGVREFSEALAVMLFYQLGELFQSYAVNKSRGSIKELMEICPEYANLEIDGEIQKVDPDDVEPGSTIIIKPGERIPLDGIVIEGDSMLDTSALTGEPVPKHAIAGEEVISGCVNGDGPLKVKTSRNFEESTVSRILELVENAGEKKARMENFITRFAKVYTPFVTVSAALLAFIPPIFWGGAFSDWLQRACVFLVISCPCALVISVPLGFFGGIGAASKAGILVKGGNYLEAVAKMTCVVFDKTGTLTKGEFKVSEINPVGITAEELLEIAAAAEIYSTHPIAQSIKDSYGKSPDAKNVSDVEEVPGKGVKAVVGGKPILLGNEKLMSYASIEYIPATGPGTAIYVAANGKFMGSILISDTIKDGMADAVASVKSAGVKSCIMLTGDRRAVAEQVGEALGIDETHAELLPQNKVERLESLLKKEKANEYLGFVGDGINDAPVLTRADIGFAMGSMGSDAAIEAADIVIMDDDIHKISKVIDIARKTLSIVKTNIVFAIGIKFVVLALGAVGIANMWAAVFADVGVATLCVLNSMRMLKVK